MSPSPKLHTHHILLADDDKDDCFLFQDALDDLLLSTRLTTVRNGEQLMLLLNSNDEALPDMLFLDLNMPRKNGLDCLSEIRQDEKLKSLPVIIISTSFVPDIVNLLYRRGANHYICKPNTFEELVKVVHYAIAVTSQGNLSQPTQEEFVLSPESCFNESPVSKRNKTLF